MVLTSESPAILKLAEYWNVIPHARSAELANDYTTKIEAIQSFLFENWKNPAFPVRLPDFKYVLSIQANSPQLIEHTAEIQVALDKLKQTDRQEIISVDADGNQHGAFRAWKMDYITQHRNLGYKMGTVVCPVTDIHTEEDLNAVSSEWDLKTAKIK